MLDTAGRTRILAQPISDDGSLPPFVAGFPADGQVLDVEAWAAWQYSGANTLNGRWTPEGIFVVLAPASRRNNGEDQSGTQASAFSATGVRRFNTTQFLAPGWHLIPSLLQPDSHGGTVVVGTAQTNPGNSSPTNDIVTLRVDVNGRVNWVARFNGAESGPDRATGIALDAEGSAYLSAVSGRLDLSGQSFTVLKYATNGTQLWSTPAEPGGALAVAIASTGEVYAAGFLNPTNSATSRFAVVKFIQSSPNQIPRIAVAPSAQEIIGGQAATWLVAVENIQPLTYQWRRNGQPLPGATNATLTLPTATFEDSGDYSVMVTHHSGEAISPEARLTIHRPPEIQGTTANTRVTVGRSTSLQVKVLGDEPLLYQWYHESTLIPGATNEVLPAANLTAELAGTYRVVITNAIGAAEASIQVEVVPTGPLDSWTWRHPLPQGNDLNAAAFGLGQYVVVGNAGTLLSTPDLAHWTHQSREEFGDLIDVVFADDRFIAIGAGGQIVSSTNGSDWTVNRAEPGATLSSIAHGNGVSVIVGSMNGGPEILTSTDGATWKPASFPNLLGSQLSDVTLGDGRFFAAWIGGSSPLLVSTNGIDWVPQTTDPNLAPRSALRTLHHSGTSLVGLTFSDTPAISTDGSRWSHPTLPDGWELHDVTGPDGNLVAVGRVRPATSDVDASRIFNSIHGTDWTTNQLTLGNNLHHVVHANDRFIALGDDGHLLYSTNGGDWTLVTPSSDQNLNGITRGADRWVAVGEDGLVLVSTDARRWAAVTSTNRQQDFTSVAYGTGRFVAATDHHGLWTSTSGDAWEAVMDVGSQDLNSVAHLRDLFIAVGSSGTLLTSPDGLLWTSRPLGTSAPLLDLAANPERIVVVGGQAVAVSEDGLSWMQVLVPSDFYGSHVAFGNGRFVATSVSGLHWISTNGLAWQRQPALPGPGLGSVLFVAGQFYATGFAGTVFSSPDGSIWQEHFTGGENNFRALALTSRGTLVGVGNNALIMESAPVLPLLSIQRAPDLTSLVQVSAWPGTYRLQATDALPAINWRDLESVTITNASTPADYPDPERTSRRFYRVVK